MQIIHTLQDMKLVDTAEKKGGNFWQVKLMNLKQTVRTRISEASLGHNEFKKRYQDQTHSIKG
jgi:hypothetical protein